MRKNKAASCDSSPFFQLLPGRLGCVIFSPATFLPEALAIGTISCVQSTMSPEMTWAFVELCAGGLVSRFSIVVCFVVLQQGV